MKLYMQPTRRVVLGLEWHRSKEVVRRQCHATCGCVGQGMGSIG